MTTPLRKSLEAILTAYLVNFTVTEDSFEKAIKREKPIAIAQLKSLIKSTLLDALPKEKRVRFPHSAEELAEAGDQFDKGYNQALKDIKDSLEGIGGEKL